MERRLLHAAGLERAHHRSHLALEAQRRRDPPPGERLAGREFFGDLPQHRHVAGGPGDPALALVGQVDVANVIGHE